MKKIFMAISVSALLISGCSDKSVSEVLNDRAASMKERTLENSANAAIKSYQSEVKDTPECKIYKDEMADAKRYGNPLNTKFTQILIEAKKKAFDNGCKYEFGKK